MQSSSSPQVLPSSRPRIDRSFPSLRSIGALILREMATSYGRSPGGYLWAVIEPITGVLVLTLAFGMILTSPPLGNSFGLFYATGVLPFTIFVSVANKVGTAIIFSKPLLSLPAVNFADALIARFVLNILTEFLIFFLVLWAILELADTQAVLDVGRIGTGLGLTALFSLGVGTMNAYLFLRFNVWHVFWSLINRPLVIISGVFFIFDKLPEVVKGWLWFNPIIHLVGTMRSGFYPGYDDYYVSELYVASVSLALLCLGFLLLSSYAPRLIEEG